MSQHETYQSKLNQTVSIETNSFRSHHVKRGKGGSENSKDHDTKRSVKEPKKVIRRKQRQRQKSQRSKASLLSSPKR